MGTSRYFSMNSSKHALRSFACAVAATTAILGCKNWQPPATRQESSAEPWTKNLRAPANKAQLSGLNAQARDIERNLGVR
jgi:hypothetical protein